MNESKIFNLEASRRAAIAEFMKIAQQYQIAKHKHDGGYQITLDENHDLVQVAYGLIYLGVEGANIMRVGDTNNITVTWVSKLTL